MDKEIIGACISAVAAIVAAIIGLRTRKSAAPRPLLRTQPLPSPIDPAKSSPDPPRESGPAFMSDEYLAWLGAEIHLNAEAGDDLRLSDASDSSERRDNP